MSGESSALSALYRLSSIPPWPHLIDLTGTLTCTRLSDFGGATEICVAVAASSSTAASSVVALQLQPWRFDVPSIHSLLSGATATRAVPCAPATVALDAMSASMATLARFDLVILPPLVSRGHRVPVGAARVLELEG